MTRGQGHGPGGVRCWPGLTLLRVRVWGVLRWAVSLRARAQKLRHSLLPCRVGAGGGGGGEAVGVCRMSGLGLAGSHPGPVWVALPTGQPPWGAEPGPCPACGGTCPAGRLPQRQLSPGLWPGTGVSLGGCRFLQVEAEGEELLGSLAVCRKSWKARPFRATSSNFLFFPLKPSEGCFFGLTP